MQLSQEETQILVDILAIVRQGFQLELGGKRPGIPPPNKQRGEYIKQGIALCDKIIHQAQQPSLIIPGQGGLIPPRG